MSKKEVSQFDHELFDAYVRNTFGEETLVDGSHEYVPIPSSSDMLNYATGNGGIPQGRIIEIYGTESSGKSTTALDYAINSQRVLPGRPIVYFDVENGFDLRYAESLGLKTDRKVFRLFQLEIVEDVLNLAFEAAKQNAALIIVDSVPALSLRKDIEENLSTDERVGGIAKTIRAHLKKIAPVLRRSGGTMIFINHITYKIGVVYGDPTTTPGGTALKYWSSIRMEVRRKENLADKKDGEPYGIKVTAKMVKNKVAPPMRRAEYDIIFGKGIDRLGGLLGAALKADVLRTSGAWVYFGEQKWKGREALMEAMKLAPELETKIRAALAEAET